MPGPKFNGNIDVWRGEKTLNYNKKEKKQAYHHLATKSRVQRSPALQSQNQQQRWQESADFVPLDRRLMSNMVSSKHRMSPRSACYGEWNAIRTIRLNFEGWSSVESVFKSSSQRRPTWRGTHISIKKIVEAYCCELKGVLNRVSCHRGRRNLRTQATQIFHRFTILKHPPLTTIPTKRKPTLRFALYTDGATGPPKDEM